MGFLKRVATFCFIAWRNIWRYPVRSMLTMFALAGGLVIVILYTVMLEGLTAQMEEYAVGVSTGHIQSARQEFIDNRDLYATLPSVYLGAIEKKFSHLVVAPRLYAAALASTENASNGVMIKAVDPKREAKVTTLLEHVQQGQLDLAWSEKESVYQVAVGTRLAKSMNIAPGSELILVSQAADGSIGNAIFKVSATLKPSEPSFDRLGVLMSTEAYRELMYLDDGYHEFAFKLASTSDLEEIQHALIAEFLTLEREIPLDELGKAVVVRNWREITPALADMLELSRAVTLIIGVIVVALASLGMVNTMMMAVHERTHEFGILLALGMKRRWLLSTVVLESFFLAIVSALIGAAVGTLLGQQFEKHGIDFSGSMPEGYDWAGISFEPIMKGVLLQEHVLNACSLMVVVAMIAAFIPSWRTMRLNPAQVMR